MNKENINIRMEKIGFRLSALSPQLLIFIVLFLFGCKKVIDVNLNEANPEVVVEANLTNTPNFAEVKLTKTGSYFGETPIEQITGAVVTIEDEIGGSFILKEVEKGYYRADEISLFEDNSYSLTVNTDKGVYTATSTLNQVVLIDSLTYFFDEGFAFLEEGYVAKIYFVDPKDKSNYYRVKVFQNDSLQNNTKDLIIFDDRLIDGQSIEIILRGFLFDFGDTISVQLISLDKGAYDYFNTFQELITVNPGSAAPANPTSNISNNALGYFSAWSADKQTVIVTE